MVNTDHIGRLTNTQRKMNVITALQHRGAKFDVVMEAIDQALGNVDNIKDVKVYLRLLSRIILSKDDLEGFKLLVNKNFKYKSPV